jgi:uncharacterized membrane protein YhaH (DUF805 family)
MAMNFWTAVQSCFRQYVGFSGRASRAEYWLWVLFTMVVSGVLHGLEGGGPQGPGPVGGAWNLATLLPSLAVASRRLHDTDRSAWWMLLPFGGFAVLGFWGALVMIEAAGNPNAAGIALPESIGLMVAGLACLGVFVLFLVWMATRGSAGANRYGADPLG